MSDGPGWYPPGPPPYPGPPGPPPYPGPQGPPPYLGLPPFPVGPPPPAPPRRTGRLVARQVVAVVLAVAAPLLLLASVQAWRMAGPELTEYLNRSLSGNEPTTASRTPGQDFFEHAVLGAFLWAGAIATSVAGVAIGRSVLRVVCAVEAAAVVCFLPLLVLFLTARNGG